MLPLLPSARRRCTSLFDAPGELAPGVVPRRPAAPWRSQRLLAARSVVPAGTSARLSAIVRSPHAAPISLHGDPVRVYVQALRGVHPDTTRGSLRGSAEDSAMLRAGARLCQRDRRSVPWDDSAVRKVRSFSGQNGIRNPGWYGALAKGDLATADREKPGALRPHARSFRERHAGRRPAGALPEYETPVRAHECSARIGDARLHGHVVPDTTGLRLLLRYPRPALVRACHA